MVCPGNTKGGSITVPLTSCLTGLEPAVWQLTIFVLFAEQTNPNQSTGGQHYSDTSPFSIPWYVYKSLCLGIRLTFLYQLV
jgi:hypothetical protein